MVGGATSPLKPIQFTHGLVKLTLDSGLVAQYFFNDITGGKAATQKVGLKIRFDPSFEWALILPTGECVS